MATSVLIKHTQSNLVKKGYYGFSWTYVFFGWFVPIVRGEIVIGALHLLFGLATAGIFWIVMWFLYNQQYMNRMLTSGWVLADTAENNIAAKLALGISVI